MNTIFSIIMLYNIFQFVMPTFITYNLCRILKYTINCLVYKSTTLSLRYLYFYTTHCNICKLKLPNGVSLRGELYQIILFITPSNDTQLQTNIHTHSQKSGLAWQRNHFKNESYFQSRCCRSVVCHLTPVTPFSRPPNPWANTKADSCAFLRGAWG